MAARRQLPRPRSRRARQRAALAVTAVATVAAVCLPALTGPGAAALVRDAQPQRHYPGAPPPEPGLLGLALSGAGSRLQPPTSPTQRPYTTDCHALVDAAFHGWCAVAKGRGGEVAGVVELEHGASATQERDLVWLRKANHWSLALVHTFEEPGYPTQLWADRARPGAAPYLVFVSPVDRAGFGRDLDLVDVRARVSLYRYLGEGFAMVPPGGGLVAYTPGASEALPADQYFDQLMVGWYGAHWRVVAQQYVPYPDALAQHRAAFWAPSAVAATPAP